MRLEIVKCKVCNIILAEYNSEYTHLDISSTIMNHMLTHIEFSSREILNEEVKQT